MTEDEEYLRSWKCMPVKRDKDGRSMHDDLIDDKEAVAKTCAVGQAIEKGLATAESEAEKRRVIMPLRPVPAVSDAPVQVRGRELSSATAWDTGVK